MQAWKWRLQSLSRVNSLGCGSDSEISLVNANASSGSEIFITQYRSGRGFLLLIINVSTVLGLVQIPQCHYFHWNHFTGRMGCLSMKQKSDEVHYKCFQ